jgi:uncharacterized protein
MILALILFSLFLSGGSPASKASDVRMLVFTRTTGFRHDSIPAGAAALRQIAAESGIPMDATEDPSDFSEENLARYRAVVFLLTTGEVLDSSQQTAFETWARAGGGFIGVHSASDTEYDWPFYGRLVGAYFAGHPAVQPGIVRVEDRGHPATAGLPEEWPRTDEWYDFRANPRPTVHVLATIDETSYSGGTMGVDHPIAWCREVDGARAFYTAGGHTSESYSEPLFLAHLAGGIRWAAGIEPGLCESDLRPAPVRVERRGSPRVITPRP